jgi:nitrate reductase gamma subunit
MDTLIYIVTYAAVLVFIVAVAVRFMRIKSYPMHIRWELYPIPHEGKRALHGGSRLEDLEWWKKKQHHDRGMQLKFMIEEMIFIKALREHNPKLWRFSFPFHFGLYLIAAFAGLVILGAVLGLFGVQMPGAVPMALGYFGAAAASLSMLGVLGLLMMRLTNVEMKPYTNFSHIFNLLFIGVTLGLMLAVFATSGFSAAPFTSYLATLLRLQPMAADATPLVIATVVTASVLLAYMPLTHMSHFFVKWFTWDKIRWDDEPNVKGGRIEKLIESALQYPVTWSADHIKGDGKRTWADVATEEMKSK